MFIITSEEIKETAFEIDYIIEEIINNTNENLNEFSKNLFKTLGKKEKNILILTLKCLKQQGNNGNIEKYIEELETIDEEKPSMFEEIITFLDKKKEDFEQFIQFKNDLNAICFDLFGFIENCKRGKISVRKIKAIAPIKVELIKKLLDIEYKFKKDKNIKNSLDILTKFRK
jgi:UDP-N-acetylglucosamine 2-epimerase